MFKFVVSFRHPRDAEAFENAYNDFLALVEHMPDIMRRQVVHVTGSPQGRAAYYRTLELYFETQEQMKAALMTTEGQEAGNELARFTDGFDVFFAEVYEEAGGRTADDSATS